MNFRVLVYFDCGHAALSENGTLTTAFQTAPKLTGEQLQELIQKKEIRADTYHANPTELCGICTKKNPYQMLLEIIPKALEQAQLPPISPEELATEIKAELQKQGYNAAQIKKFCST